MRVLRVDLQVVMQDPLSVAQPEMETAILLAAQQAAAKYAPSLTPHSVYMVTERPEGGEAPPPPMPYCLRPYRN